jgi:hypothetical protein
MLDRPLEVLDEAGSLLVAAGHGEGHHGVQVIDRITSA